MKFSLVDLPAFLAVALAAYVRFGAISAIGIVGAVYLLAPYYAIASIDAGKGRIR